jgi:hypothetical protein
MSFIILLLKVICNLTKCWNAILNSATFKWIQPHKKLVISLYTGCFRVLATSKLSRHQMPWNLSLDGIYLIWSSLQCFYYEIQLFSLQIIINSYQNIISPDVVNTVGYAVDTLTDLLMIYIISTNIILMDLYIIIRDWKVTSRNTKYRHIKFWEQRSKLSWKALSLKQNFRKMLI